MRQARRRYRPSLADAFSGAGGEPDTLEAAHIVEQLEQPLAAAGAADQTVMQADGEKLGRAALALAIQGLYRQLQAKDREIAELKAKTVELDARLAAIESGLDGQIALTRQQPSANAVAGVHQRNGLPFAGGSRERPLRSHRGWRKNCYEANGPPLGIQIVGRRSSSRRSGRTLLPRRRFCE